VRFFIVSSGKVLADPLFVFLSLALAGVLVCIVQAPRSSRQRRIAMLTLVPLLLLAFLATPAAAILLYRSIILERSGSQTPAFIVVPSAGSSHVGSSREVILSSTSISRIVEAVHWWREDPGAVIIATGGDITPEGTVSQTVDEMRAEALRRGVPATSIRVESRSRNTREHAIELAKILPPDANFGIVSSAWHLRRVRASFKLHFRSFALRPCEDPREMQSTITDLVPSSGGLHWSTVMLQEWVGMAWYALRS
jgi:uncharacterized SAM-binding protein YcdF (DUF218 family)